MKLIIAKFERALDEMYQLGAQFNGSIDLNYTRLNLISHEPQLIGNYSQIMQSKNETLINNFIDFYKNFQKSNGTEELLKQVFQAYIDITIKKEFFFYYNDVYWYLSLKQPYVKVSYEKIPLPGTNRK
jgi:ceroid-lipofuscinosis neuronal protein 5